MKPTNLMKPTIKIGLGIMIFKEGRVLLGKRKGSHGAGEYAFPGGHLEFGESFYDCAIREVKEEAGLTIKNLRFQLLANLKKYGHKQYAHIGLIADWQSGQAKTLEPDKNEGWQWYPLDKLPSPLFESCRLAIDSYTTGQNYYDNIV